MQNLRDASPAGSNKVPGKIVLSMKITWNDYKHKLNCFKEL